MCPKKYCRVLKKKNRLFLFSGLIANEQAEKRRLNATRSIAAGRKILDRAENCNVSVM